MKTERSFIWGCKNMEEPVSEGERLAQHKKQTKQTTCMVRFSTEKGFSVHICISRMDRIGTGFDLIRRTKHHPNLTNFTS